MTDTVPGAARAAPAAPAMQPPARRNGLGTAALVVGVVALVLAVLFVFAPLGALLGLTAAILGAFGLLRANQGLADNRGQAVAGLVTGLAGLVIGVAFTVSVGTFLARHATDFSTFGNCLDQATTSQARETCALRLADTLER